MTISALIKKSTKKRSCVSRTMCFLTNLQANCELDQIKTQEGRES